MTAAVYPGSFDPVTNGHLDLIERGSRLFDRLVVAVASNDSKQPLFTTAERLALLEEAMGDRFSNVELTTFDGLITRFARERGIPCLLRGLRTLSDFEYEFQMALTNRDLEPGVETVFVMPSHQYAYVSSRLIKESVRHGADVSHLIPRFVQDRLRQKLRPAKPSRELKP